MLGRVGLKCQQPSNAAAISLIIKVILDRQHNQGDITSAAAHAANPWPVVLVVEPLEGRLGYGVSCGLRAW